MLFDAYSARSYEFFSVLKVNLGLLYESKDNNFKSLDHCFMNTMYTKSSALYGLCGINVSLNYTTFHNQNSNEILRTNVP